MRIAFFLLVVVIATFGCKNSSKQSNVESSELTIVESSFLQFSSDKLKDLGVAIKDSMVMYNNVVEGVGSLNLTIRNKVYSIDAATTEQTHLNFYPRYITTLDTIQRTMYRMKGEYAQSMEEAHKWDKFENLVPVVVKQEIGEYTFGETLVFWFTKSPDLDKLLSQLDEK